jgi:hypothetical protein
MLADESLGKLLKNPSLSYGSQNLYAHGVFEEETRPNLSKKIKDLVSDKALLTVNDKALPAPMRVVLKFH